MDNFTEEEIKYINEPFNFKDKIYILEMQKKFNLEFKKEKWKNTELKK